MAEFAHQGDLRGELESLLNSHSAENTSNTPDFILAGYLESCLAAFDMAVQQRETWYGRDARPSEPFTELSPTNSAAPRKERNDG